MNPDITKIGDLLRAMGWILNECNEPGWAGALALQAKRLREGGEKETGEIARELLRLFAGAGSFSDLVLHQNGEAGTEINDRFDILRAELSRKLLELLSGRGNGREIEKGDA